MKWVILTLLFSLNSSAQLPITGTWLTGNKLAKIEVSHKAGKYEARIVWLEIPDYDGKPAHDKNNENPKLRSRKLMGLNLFEEMEVNEDGLLVGNVYDPYRGRTFYCEIWPENKSVLNVRGYLGVFFQTKQWTRVN